MLTNREIFKDVRDILSNNGIEVYKSYSDQRANGRRRIKFIPIGDPSNRVRSRIIQELLNYFFDEGLDWHRGMIASWHRNRTVNYWYLAIHFNEGSN